MPAELHLGWNVEVMGELRPETAAGIRAVFEANKMMRERKGVDDHTSKTGRDIVTATDIAIEDQIRSVLTETLHIPVVGEERGGDDKGDSYWLVDPICGTRNFASGIPLYCANLALIEKGRVTIAVVGDPSSADQILVAQEGLGAWALADKSARKLVATSKTETVIIEPGSGSEGVRREMAAKFTAEMIRLNRWELRTFSSTLSLAYVASGRVAAYALFSISAVHAAAGSLLATEAGAILSDLQGNPWTLEADSLVASAEPAIHQELIELIAKSER